MNGLASRQLLACLGATLILTACGGGDGDSSGTNSSVNSSSTSSASSSRSSTSSSAGSSSSTSSSTSSSAANTKISGTAAAGAPIIGSITVKDSLGATRFVNIGSADNGHFSIDVSGMKAPFVFRATGTANGETWTLYSPASAADTGGVLNITPFTDLILSNIAGQLAANYFDSGNFGSMSKSDIDAEAAKLRERLLPVLQDLGVNAAVDLLHTPFTPLADQLDKALDIVHVSYDTAGTVATLTNIITSQTITDSLATKAAAETNAPVMTSSTDVATASTDMPAIAAALKSYNDLFTTALPTKAQVTARLTTGFVFWDESSSQFGDWVSADTFWLGLKFTNVEVTSIDYANVNGPTAKVSFTIANANGVEIERVRNFRMRKSNGQWLLHGNRQCVKMKVVAHTSSTVLSNGSGLVSALGFQFEDVNPGNCGTNKNTAVAYAIVKGPGLPTNGVKYNAPATGGEYVRDGGTDELYIMAQTNTTGSSTSTLTDMSTAILNIPDNAKYVVTLFDANGNKIPDSTNSTDGVDYGDSIAYAGDVLRLPKRPLTLSELVAESTSSSSRFPTITAPTTSQLASYAGDALTVSAGNLNPQHYVWLFLRYTTTGGVEERDEADAVPSAAGQASAAFSLNSATASTINRREIRVETMGDGYRYYMKSYYFGS